jgi:radical SAM superfamily enzyme YgiQ (UPF0313 family)
MIDCTDIYKTRKRYGTGKYPREIIDKPDILKPVPRNFARYGISIEAYKEVLRKQPFFDMVFVTSIMTYWYPGVGKTIEIIRDLHPAVPVILGGIYASLYEKHARQNSGADHIYTGPVNSEIDKVMRRFGFHLKRKNKPVSYYTLDLYRSYPFAPIMTSTGCPYRCAYCASSYLVPEFNQRNPAEVFREIMELYNLGVRDFAFYDDALFVHSDTHLKVILTEVINAGLHIRFHCPNGVHARFIDNDLAVLLKKSGFTTLRISLETVDTVRQTDTGGKITSEAFEQSILALKAAGFQKDHIGVYLMYGLPGQDLAEVKKGVNFLKGLDVRINLTEFSPLPYTKCWNDLIANSVIDGDIDPLLTNNSVFSTLYAGYDWRELEILKNSVTTYNSK